MKTKVIVLLVTVLFAGALFWGIKEAIRIDKAHNTFENYYAFRGCVKLLKGTDTYGICKTDQGKTIRLVKYQGKWYLDGDLPICYLGICL